MEQTLLNANAKDVVEMKINGRSFFGRNISITQNSITIDGVTSIEVTPKIKVEILGSCDSIESASGDVVVHGAAQKIKTMSGDVTCESVFGPISTMSGDVKCGDISGSVSTMSGDIKNKGVSA